MSLNFVCVCVPLNFYGNLPNKYCILRTDTFDYCRNDLWATEIDLPIDECAVENSLIVASICCQRLDAMHRAMHCCDYIVPSCCDSKNCNRYTFHHWSDSIFLRSPHCSCWSKSTSREVDRRIRSIHAYTDRNVIFYTFASYLSMNSIVVHWLFGGLCSTTVFPIFFFLYVAQILCILNYAHISSACTPGGNTDTESEHRRCDKIR